MPIYEYKCKKCNKTFEMYQIRYTNKDQVQCPFCKSEEILRKISPFSSFSDSASSTSSSCSPKSKFFR
ncbi:MAG: hypothetical protein A2Y62_18105 [Candidatus Fischerbacteria bacterium RBG_13_37_8]|uniref:Putative regulatory protein FmdB zinc ribbon domain-containing protein n=1 Tax=Candidatus Fischerbacteria bacterium RBG_13_37_8 TaxID=1817863 RepID=A0A1F5VVG6_9BACT|nr:MAG: hypothetical protein A2Y62_18105 [Candidatus Fischerbacteria bacterium RBG_13_37_8]